MNCIVKTNNFPNMSGHILFSNLLVQSFRVNLYSSLRTNQNNSISRSIFQFILLTYFAGTISCYSFIYIPITSGCKDDEIICISLGKRTWEAISKICSI